jgi:cytochrome P450
MSVDSSQAVEELSKDFMAHPYEILERLRAAGPAHPVIFPHGAKVWLVTGYDDVRQLLTDPRVSKDGLRANELFARHSGMAGDEDEPGSIGVNDELTRHMLNSDPPRHTRLRSLANQGLTPKRMEDSRPRLEQVADELRWTTAGRWWT